MGTGRIGVIDIILGAGEIGIIQRMGVMGPILAIAVYIILTFTPIPTDPLTIMLGALYGPFYGLLISWVGNTAAAIVEYFVARHVGTLTNFKAAKKKLPWGLGKLPVDSVWFLMAGRLVPGFGSKLVSLLAGFYHVGFIKYLWTTALITLVGSLGFVLSGHYFTRL